MGAESKSETEALPRKAIADYEEQKFVVKSENITVGEMLDMWIEEDLKPSNFFPIFSPCLFAAYISAIFPYLLSAFAGR